MGVGLIGERGWTVASWGGKMNGRKPEWESKEWVAASLGRVSGMGGSQGLGEKEVRVVSNLGEQREGGSHLLGVRPG